jgi:chromosome segregation ATPase
MQELATKSDFGAISESLTNLQAKQAVLDTVEKSVKAQQAPIQSIWEKTVEADESITTLTKAVADLAKQVKELRTEQTTAAQTREELLTKIRKAVSELPSRQQGKFTQLIN